MSVALAEVLVFVSPRRTAESALIGERLRAERSRRGFTAREVALRMGLTSPDGYRQYEKGNIRNWSAALPRLARGMRMDIAELSEMLDVPIDSHLEALPGRILQAVGAERAHRVEEIFDEIADLPEEDQDTIIQGLYDQVQGIKHRLRLLK